MTYCGRLVSGAAWQSSAPRVTMMSASTRAAADSDPGCRPVAEQANIATATHSTGIDCQIRVMGYVLQDPCAAPAGPHPGGRVVCEAGDTGHIAIRRPVPSGGFELTTTTALASWAT